MRFINTTTFKFQELSDEDIRNLPNGYSILSHRWTWGGEEIVYHDVLSMDSTVKAKGGYPKFIGSCALAKKLGYNLIWIDTCCINKTDSVELGEAINSMYRWYALSNVCIAFLEDIVSSAPIENSEWFTRGWTLQELIAPRAVQFYDTNWVSLGDKGSLSKVIVGKTGIPEDVLKNKKHPRACSVAQRMSWAAGRTTGRVEDRAYSLMGLFDVNMPMIYGEREQAFLRLQQHIISKSADESIFAWDINLVEDSTERSKTVYFGLLATSPAPFAGCGDIISLGNSKGFRINQFGLSISLPLESYGLGISLAHLSVENSKGTIRQYAIFLIKLNGEGKYARTCSNSGTSYRLMPPKLTQESTQLTIPLDITEPPVRLYPGFWLRNVRSHDPQLYETKILERGYSPEDDRMRLPDGEIGTAGIIEFSLWYGGQPAGVGWIKLGFDDQRQPTCAIILPKDNAGPTTSQFMQRQSAELLAIPRGSIQWLNHPIFNSTWTTLSHHLYRDFPTTSYYVRGGKNFNGNLNVTLNIYQQPRFDICVYIRRVPDMEETKVDAPVEVCAVDVVCNAAAPPQPPQDWNYSCCGCF